MNERRYGGGRRPLRQEADPDNWGDALMAVIEEQQQAKSKNAIDQTRNEVRWGDLRRFSIDIPASGSDATIVPDAQPIQLLNVGPMPPKVWTLALNIQWTNPSESVALDTITGQFLYEIGVGSARIGFIEQLVVPQASPFPIVSKIVDAQPFSTLYLSTRLVILAHAGPARKVNGSMAAFTAPYFR